MALLYVTLLRIYILPPLQKKKKRREVKNKQQKERSSREVTFLQEFYVLGITQLLMNDIV